RAIVAMTHRTVETVDFLAKRLSPASDDNSRRIRDLIADLDAETFQERDKAEDELRTLGDRAEVLLHETLQKQPSPEMKSRLERLIEAIEQGTPSGQILREIRAVEILERIGTSGARSLLEKLALGAPTARLTREAKAAVFRLRMDDR